MNRIIQNLKDVREDAGRGWIGYTPGSKLHKRIKLIDLLIGMEERSIVRTIDTCPRCREYVELNEGGEDVQKSRVYEREEYSHIKFMDLLKGME